MARELDLFNERMEAPEVKEAIAGFVGHQVLLSILLLAGLVRESRTGETSWALAAVIILGPLVRYENVALSGPALCYLFARRHFRFRFACGLRRGWPCAHARRGRRAGGTSP